MKKILNSVNAKFHEPKAFWIGALYTFFFIFVLMTWYFFGDDFFEANGTRSSNGVHPFFLLVFTLPGLLIFIYALKPKTTLGNVGKYCFKFLSFIFTRRR